MRGIGKFLLILVIGLGLSAVIYLAPLNPVLGQLSKLNGELRQKKIELATLDQQITAYKNAQADLSRASEKDLILEAILDKEELVAAIKNLEEGAALTRTEETLKINEPDPESKEKVVPVLKHLDNLEEIPYRVISLNDFLGTIQFIRYLEHLPEFTEITQINLSAETVDSESSKTKIYTGRVFGSIDGIFLVKAKNEIK